MSVDVSESVKRVQCPTLILHARDDRRIPFSQALQNLSLLAGPHPPHRTQNFLLPIDESRFQPQVVCFQMEMNEHILKTAVFFSKKLEHPEGKNANSTRIEANPSRKNEHVGHLGTDPCRIAVNPRWIETNVARTGVHPGRTDVLAECKGVPSAVVQRDVAGRALPAHFAEIRGGMAKPVSIRKQRLIVSSDPKL